MFVQIVKFKLKPDASREAFLDLAEQMIAWLKIRPGFVAYELYEADEFWSDRIAWENQKCAQAGLDDFLATAIAQKMIPLVEDGYSSFFGQRVAFAERHPMPVHIEPVSELKDVLELLALCGLETADISPIRPPQFFGIRSGAELVAVVGLEVFGPVALLRSLAVLPPYRGRGLARQLVAHAESTAATLNVDSIFLLTTSASEFFAKLGYVSASRTQAPPAIQATAQFTSLCPASSAFFRKSVTHPTQR